MYAWHFTDGWKLRDGRELVLGKTYRHRGKLYLCDSGLHASIRAIDALGYAPGSVISHVEVGPTRLESNDKMVATSRAVLWAYDAEEELHVFARLCALDVINNWDAPQVVRDWLETGDASLRAKAHSAAYLVAYSTARLAAGSAAYSAAGSAAYSAASSAAYPAAYSAAYSAAYLETRSAQNLTLETLLYTSAVDRGLA